MLAPKTRDSKQIVKAGQHAPSAQGVKNNTVRIRRFVGMIFVEQMPAGMLRIHQLVQFPTQNFHLLVRENANALQIAIFAKEFELFFTQAVLFPVSGKSGK